MKAQELRIGNYLKSLNGKNSIVTKIGYKETKDYVKHYYIIFEGSNNGYFLNNHSVELITPIKLSSDILIKLGATYVFANIFNLHGFMYDLNSNTFFSENTSPNGGTYICYLHNLQNIYFALTNNELNFKAIP
jgi:hypothetical protein